MLYLCFMYFFHPTCKQLFFYIVTRTIIFWSIQWFHRENIHNPNNTSHWLINRLKEKVFLTTVEANWDIFSIFGADFVISLYTTKDSYFTPIFIILSILFQPLCIKKNLKECLTPALAKTIVYPALPYMKINWISKNF